MRRFSAGIQPGTLGSSTLNMPDSTSFSSTEVSEVGDAAAVGGRRSGEGWQAMCALRQGKMQAAKELAAANGLMGTRPGND